MHKQGRIETGITKDEAPVRSGVLTGASNFPLTTFICSVNITDVATSARSEYGVVLKRLKRTVC